MQSQGGTLLQSLAVRMCSRGMGVPAAPMTLLAREVQQIYKVTIIQSVAATWHHRMPLATSWAPFSQDKTAHQHAGNTRRQ